MHFTSFPDPPRCRKGFEIMRVGGLPFETIVVQCAVDAVPEVTKFSWTYNTSRGVFAVQGDKINNRGDISLLHFTPSTDDIESLSCWASNSIGQQEKPCLFLIVPAGEKSNFFTIGIYVFYFIFSMYC